MHEFVRSVELKFKVKNSLLYWNTYFQSLIDKAQSTFNNTGNNTNVKTINI